jgi:hypothetical protein
MIRFAKRAICPPPEMLEAYRDSALAPVLIRAVAAHLCDCDFCAAEYRLCAVVVARKTDAAVAPTEGARDAAHESSSEIAHARVEGESDAPLALRLFGESRLAESALRSSLSRLRVA